MFQLSDLGIHDDEHYDLGEMVPTENMYELLEILSKGEVGSADLPDGGSRPGAVACVDEILKVCRSIL